MALDLDLVGRQLYPPPRPRSRWHHDPAGFVTDCIDWGGLDGPTPYQLDNLDRLVPDGRRAIRGPHGLGKTAGNAWAVLWFSTTRELAGLDWKIPTTASAWRQLQQFLWPEIHKWARRLRWDVIGREPFGRSELLTLNLNLGHGQAFAVACDDPATIEGAHADQLLYIFDEAKTIPEATFDAAEGAFSGGGATADIEAYALASSTPGPPVGRFYDICKHKAGYEDWTTRHVTLAEVIDAGRVSADWAEQRARQWGQSSAVYLNRVRGEFAASDEDSVIPLAWVEAANERWETRVDTGDGWGTLTHVGVDVARYGSDVTVLALRYGPSISELRRSYHEPTTATVGRVIAAQRGSTAEAVVDVIGMGGGVVDQLREQGWPVAAFNAGWGTDLTDSSGELEFANWRSAAWWHMREILDPDNDAGVALPPDDALTGDLTAPTWKVTSAGRVQVERKVDVKKRLGRSTDDADAVIQSFWPERRPETDGELVHAEDLDSDFAPVRISPY